MSQPNLPEPRQSLPADEQNGGDDFEISTLPAHTEPSHVHPTTSGSRFALSARGWRWVAATAALLLVFAVIFDMAYQASRPTDGFSYAPLSPQNQTPFSSIPTETIYHQKDGPVPTPPPSGQLALKPAPASCPSPFAIPASQTALKETIGAGTVWVGSFTGAHATMIINQKPLPGLSQYGWPVLVTVLVRSDFDHPVTISGADLNTSYPLWWSFPPADEDPNATPSTSTTFTPQHPAPGTPTFWFSSYGTLFLPGAGCYLLQATWPSGGWKFVFAAGS